MSRMSVITILVALSPLFSAASQDCANGICDVADHTNLMQFKKVITPSSERTGDSLYYQDGSNFMARAPLPAKCTELGPCIGHAPHCGGNTYDCTKIGMKVIGWVKACFCNNTAACDVCESGYKVQCATCAADFKDVERPTPNQVNVELVKPWKQPAAPKPIPAKPAAAAAKPVTFPHGNPSFPAPTFDPWAVGNATAAVKAAYATLELMQQKLHNVTELEHTTRVNISKFKHAQDDAHAAFESDRIAAVKFAKKRELANITYGRTHTALENAFWAEQGAAKAAHVNHALMENANAEKRYYSKQCIDKTHLKVKAQHNLEVGRTAVKKSHLDLHSAKQAFHRHVHNIKSASQLKTRINNEGVKLAKHRAVHTAMNDAYNESSDHHTEMILGGPMFGDSLPTSPGPAALQ